MAVCALEINDTGILAVAESGPLAPPSPGYACLENGSILVGEEARARARKHPLFVLDGFWTRLDRSPLPRPFPRHMTQADLVHAHLLRFWEGLGSGSQLVILAVPGCWSEEQLALLLGVARASSLPVAGLVDSAVAALCGVDGETSALHLDLMLHKVVLTELRVGETVIRERVSVDEKAGLAQLERRWAAAISDLFVRRTRFDPLHSAEAEQRLFDALPGWLAQVGEYGMAETSLSAGGKSYSVELTLKDATAAIEPLLGRLERLVGSRVQAGGTRKPLFLSSRAARLPGLEARLREPAGGDPVVLRDGAAGFGALRSAMSIVTQGEELPYVLELPRLAVEVAATPPAEATTRPRRAPTHLVVEGVVHRLAPGSTVVGVPAGDSHQGPSLPEMVEGHPPAPFEVSLLGHGVEIKKLGDGALEVNGAPLTAPARVWAGDRLRVGRPGVELLFVVEAENHGKAQG